ncbi:hypothetical protein ACCO45_006909 [Purpureocillium lilacinum]|uniref:Uncharacterized protein n=1 Tax=Purpureocillium lilacinum TaxID=33203 RepID=A0ACC4DQT9_PURLI
MASDPRAADGELFMSQVDADAATSTGENATAVHAAPLELKHHPEQNTTTPEPLNELQRAESDTPSTPGHLLPFDWDDFEGEYFRAWAAAASVHDDERAIKRLRTRQRFVNLSEEKAAQKQQHYEEVVKAFESALALLQGNVCVVMAADKDAGCTEPPSQLQVSSDDLANFFEAHFTPDAVANFGWAFMNPDVYSQSQDTSAQCNWDYEDDGLGYYEDGVKRTLTDEDIEFFRQSELRELRQQQSRSQAGTSKPEASSANRVSKKTNKRNGKNGRREPKPDLRKRTWDVVDAGLDTLNYD